MTNKYGKIFGTINGNNPVQKIHYFLLLSEANRIRFMGGFHLWEQQIKKELNEVQ